MCLALLGFGMFTVPICPGRRPSPYSIHSPVRREGPTVLRHNTMACHSGWRPRGRAVRGRWARKCKTGDGRLHDDRAGTFWERALSSLTRPFIQTIRRLANRLNLSVTTRSALNTLANTHEELFLNRNALPCLDSIRKIPFRYDLLTEVNKARRSSCSLLSRSCPVMVIAASACSCRSLAMVLIVRLCSS